MSAEEKPRFDPAEWDKAREAEEQLKQAQKQASKGWPRFYYVGLYKTKSNKIATFLTRHYINVPLDYISLFGETLSLEALLAKKKELEQEAARRTEVLRLSTKEIVSPKINVEGSENSIEITKVSLQRGSVVYCSDSDKTHTGILLDFSIPCKVLYLTSNAHWNKRARVATLEEVALCGMPQKRITYLAPVLVPKENIFNSGINYPEARILELLSEFLEGEWF